MRRQTVLIAALLAHSGVALALDHPVHSPVDHRVRYVTYNPADVVQLDTVLGTATYIMLEPGERVVMDAFGDSAAYTFNHKDHHLVLKPSAEDANTNLILVTDRRSYVFRLSYSDSRNTQAVYKLEFRYPESEAKEAAQARDAQRVAQAFEERLGEIVSWEDYMMSGDTSIAPVHAWDNGQHTWLQFASSTDLPAIYLVDADGQESLVNRHTEGADSRTIVLHRTAARWMLRLGQQALLVHNEAYGLTPTPTNTSRTASPEVRRVLVEGL